MGLTARAGTYDDRLKSHVFYFCFNLVLLEQERQAKVEEILHLRDLKLNMIKEGKYDLIDTQTAIRTVTKGLGKI